MTLSLPQRLSFLLCLPAVAVADKRLRMAKSPKVTFPTVIPSGVPSSNPSSFPSASGVPSSKPSSSPTFCEAEAAAPVIEECGLTFTDKEVELSDDLFCTDAVDPDGTGTGDPSLTAAITLEGPDAVLDCKDHSVLQFSAKNAAVCNWDQQDNTRAGMKKECDLFYQIGIHLKGGAKAVNCNVESFFHGFYVEEGGEVSESEASRNKEGIAVQNEADGETSKVSKVYAHLNGVGITVSARPATNPPATVSIEDAMCKNNVKQGMRLRGSDISVKDSITSHNERGISIVGELKASLTKVKFEGEVSSHRNIELGLQLRSGGPANSDYSEVIFAGVFNTYLNGVEGEPEGYGLIINEDMDMLDPGFTVEEGGSFNSCQNTGEDIWIKGGGSRGNVHVKFVDDTSGGDGYACDTQGRSDEGGDFPTCVACPSCD